jgi:dihydroxy-acid dehydratase
MFSFLSFLCDAKKANGWIDEDFNKPIITVASPWSTANPCNYHHRELTDLLCAAIEKKGGKAFVAGTPIISDGYGSLHSL